jgi:4-alpha-glucanotransferase
MTADFTPKRRSGVLVPLFSLWSSRSWGIGEIPDLSTTARWLRSAGQRFVQLLPITEMAPHDTSPYSALSAMAVDPQYVALPDVEDFAAAGGETALPADAQSALRAIRENADAPRVDYKAVRIAKQLALRVAYGQFRRTEWVTGSRRAAAFRAFVAEEGWWLDDYALYRALRAHHGERPWSEWPAPLRDRTSGALAVAALELEEEVRYRQYVQWLVAVQWREMRQGLGSVALFGDLPFMVAGDSADVWARQEEFRHDASVGVPPDVFSATGQDWELPVYRWDVIAAGDFAWLRSRARRYAALYDGYRVDHLVGFYRTYFRPHDGEPPQFTPATEVEQIQLGERVLQLLRDSGAEITAEDLGLVPDFVRASLVRLGVPGYKVFRWERQWKMEGHPFIDPVEYSPATVATSGTHDTEPLALWWENVTEDERIAVLAVPSIRATLPPDESALKPPATFNSSLRDALLNALYGAGSALLILPIQDVFGWRDRINTPATVNEVNWTWKLPWPVDRLDEQPAAASAARRLNALAWRFGR